MGKNGEGFTLSWHYYMTSVLWHVLLIGHYVTKAEKRLGNGNWESL